MARDVVLTIGYGNRPIDAFLGLIKRHEIDAICDVRSSPYSSRFPDFSREPLREALLGIGTKYVFLGEELGARPSGADMYEGGRASYEAMKKSSAFRQGIERIEAGLKTYSLALLCAEKDPLNCHRSILIARTLVRNGYVVNHIGAKDELESHSDLESRLLRMFGLDQGLLFGSLDRLEALEEAYRRRGHDLAYDVDAAYRGRYAK